jgi:two-component system response regulator QseB
MESKRSHVLLIEDDQTLGQSTQELLAMAGFDTVWSSSVKDAFAQLSTSTYHAVFLDLNLGADDGVELIQALRSSGHRIPPLIILSAQTPSVLRTAASEVGAVLTLQKPCALAALVSALTFALHPSRS